MVFILGKQENKYQIFNLMGTREHSKDSVFGNREHKEIFFFNFGGKVDHANFSRIRERAYEGCIREQAHLGPGTWVASYKRIVGL